MKKLSFLLKSTLLAIFLAFSAPTISFGQEIAESAKQEQAATATADSDSLVAQLNDVLAKLQNLTDQGKEIPQDIKDLVSNVRTVIDGAPTPTDRQSVEYWVNLIMELFVLLLAAVVGTWTLAEALGIVQKGLLAKFVPAVENFRKRYLVVLSAAIMTVLSLTVFKGENGWTYIEAAAFLLPILFGAVRTNVAAVNMGLKKAPAPTA